MQPSSAAAERVFTLLAASFDDQQTNALQGYVENFNHARVQQVMNSINNFAVYHLQLYMFQEIFENNRHILGIIGNILKNFLKKLLGVL